MKRALIVSVLVAAAAGLAALSRRPPRSPSFRAPGVATSADNRRASLCPPGTLPDQGVCIPVPRTPAATFESTETVVPRRPDRPADYSHYALPVADSGSPRVVARDPSVTRDSGAPRGGIWISGTTGTAVFAPSLEGQDGPVRVVFTGSLVGASAVTRHSVRSADRTNDYVVIVGNLDAVPALVPKSAMEKSAPLGKVGRSPVYLECRMLRDGVDPYATPAERFFDEAVAVSVDPRNVLELRH